MVVTAALVAIGGLIVVAGGVAGGWWRRPIGRCVIILGGVITVWSVLLLAGFSIAAGVIGIVLATVLTWLGLLLRSGVGVEDHPGAHRSKP